MKILHPTLINYPHITQLYDYAKEKGIKVFLSKAGILHTERITCCGILCNYNGSNNTGHIISRSVDSFFKKGQQACSVCGKTHQVENEFIDNLKDELDKFIISQALGLREIHTSYPDISSFFKNQYGINISEKTIDNICTSILFEFDDVTIDYEIEDGFYGYDEQWITVNGKKMLRIVIYDVKNNVPIYEEKHETLTKKILENILKTVFKDKSPKGFVFDMQPMYPNAFQRVFGKKIKLQFCLFHLNKLILEEYRKALKVGNKVQWSLVHYYNLYSLFNIFYNRRSQLKLLKAFQERLDKYKDKLKGINDINAFRPDIKFPKACKSIEHKRNFLLNLYEKQLIKKFRNYLHQEKLRRKRNNETLKVRTKRYAKQKLDAIIEMIGYFPKNIQNRINKIKENFELFTGSNREVVTNNKLEGFFGITLKKFRKKGFHTNKALQNFFNFRKIKQLGISITETFSLQRLSTIFGIVTLFST